MSDTLTKFQQRFLARQTSPKTARLLSDGLNVTDASAASAAAADASAAAAAASAAADAASTAAAEASAAAAAATELVPTTTHTTNQTAAYGQLVVMDATAGALTVTAPDPAGNAGKRWGLKLIATASAHSVTAVAHAAETFDGGAAPAVTVAGSLYVFTSNGTNWIITAKI